MSVLFIRVILYNYITEIIIKQMRLPLVYVLTLIIYKKTLNTFPYDKIVIINKILT